MSRHQQYPNIRALPKEGKDSLASSGYCKNEEFMKKKSSEEMSNTLQMSKRWYPAPVEQAGSLMQA